MCPKITETCARVTNSLNEYRHNVEDIDIAPLELINTCYAKTV